MAGHGPNYYLAGWRTCIDCGAPKTPGHGYWCPDCRQAQVERTKAAILAAIREDASAGARTR